MIRAPTVPTGDPRTWGAGQLQDWFKTHAGGKWAKYASKFVILDGGRMTALTKEDVVDFTDSSVGRAIYNDWHKLLGAGTLASLCYCHHAFAALRCLPACLLPPHRARVHPCYSR